MSKIVNEYKKESDRKVFRSLFEWFLLDFAETFGMRNCDFLGENARIKMRARGKMKTQEKERAVIRCFSFDFSAIVSE